MNKYQQALDRCGVTGSIGMVVCWDNEMEINKIEWKEMKTSRNVPK